MFVKEFCIMNKNHFLLGFFFFVITSFCSLIAVAQPNTNISLDKDKPIEYENRILGSEKTGQKKFTIFRRFIQNTITHYNYYFNANRKLNNIIATAKLSFKEDYTNLLPFYNYTLDETATKVEDIDSIVYKCTAGILLHDLRNDWVDNLYMVLGKSYILRKAFDSASGCFQYINFTYAPKDEGYDIPLGSNVSGTKGVFTIATKEKRSIFKKIFSKPPSRNESFIWQARNYIEQDLLGEASGLISILRNDPFFPKRLHKQLHEVTAFLFYKQQNYDSAAWHLQQCLSNATNKQEKARWEYLVGQLYKLGTNSYEAIKMFEKSIKHSPDPVLEVYARLNIVPLLSGNTQNILAANINELNKLAKKDRYAMYRDIIYYAAAKLELNRNNDDKASNYLLKSIANNTDNAAQKAMSFLLLAQINYNNKNYLLSHNYYDSIQLKSLTALSSTDSASIAQRKPALKIIAQNSKIIYTEDSLQKIAAKPALERITFIKKLLKKLRKERGLKVGDDESYNNYLANTNATPNLFTTNTTDFYFNNTSLKAKGFSEFKSRWGKRNNVDNWRRVAATNNNANFGSGMVDINDVNSNLKDPEETSSDTTQDELTFESLMNKLPLTAEQLQASNKKLINAMFENGKVFHQQLEDYHAAVNMYQSVLHLSDSVQFENKETLLFNLYYCYIKLGLTAKADSMLALLNATYPTSNSAKLLSKENRTSTTKLIDPLTTQYQKLYALFESQNYTSTINEINKAGNTFEASTWASQILYLKALCYIKLHNESSAIQNLNLVIQKFPQSTLATKAATLLDALKRRSEIETQLTNTTINRKTDTVLTYTPDTTLLQNNKPAIANMASNKFNFVATEPHFVMIVFDNIDATFFKESKQAFVQYNNEKYYTEKLNTTDYLFNAQTKVLLIGSFLNSDKAMAYLDKTKPLANSKIISFINANKYKFFIIDNSNLNLLKTNNNFSEYIQMLQQAIPGKF